MIYGSLRTEIKAYSKPNNEIISYLVVTAWQPIDSKENQTGWSDVLVSWETKITHSNGKPVDQSGWWDIWADWLKANHVDQAKFDAETRIQIAQEHAFAVRGCMG